MLFLQTNTDPLDPGSAFSESSASFLLPPPPLPSRPIPSAQSDSGSDTSQPSAPRTKSRTKWILLAGLAAAVALAGLVGSGLVETWTKGSDQECLNALEFRPTRH